MRSNSKLNKWFIKFATQSPVALALLFVFVGWYLLTLKFPPYMFPPMTMVYKAIIGFYEAGDLWVNIWATTWRVAASFITAVILATLVGMSMGYFKLVETGFKPTLFIIQTVSSVVWCFFAVIWFRANDFAACFVMFIVSFPIITVNVWEGAKNVDLRLEAMAKAFNVSKWDQFTGIIVPSVMPYLFAGVRSSLSYCWKISVLAEMMVGVKGIGYWMNYNWGQAEFTEVVAWVGVMVVLMLLSEYTIIRPIESYVMRWRPKRSDT